MTLLIRDRVKETSTTTGTGTLTLAGAVIGFQSFSAIGNANTCYYAIEGVDASGAPTGDWETGVGTYTSSGTTLSRDVIIASSNSGAAVNLAAGTKNVYVTLPATRAILDQNLGFSLINGYLTAAVGGSALTVAIKNFAGNDPSAADPVRIIFRNATAATGDYVVITLVAATSFVVSSGSTLGTTNSVAFRLWIVGFNDAGTFRLGAVNRNVALGLVDHGLYSSTTEGGAGAADSASVIYTGTGVTTKAMKLLGYMDWDSGLGTAGTWSAGPTRIQLFGPGVPAPGSLVHSTYDITTTNSSTATTVPFDDTIPQNTEGAQFHAITHTRQAAQNLLVISWFGWGAVSAANNITSSLFQDSTANALVSNSVVGAAADYTMPITLLYKMLAAATGDTTIKFRSGGNTGTFYFLSTSAGHKCGAAGAAVFEVKEIMG